MDEKARKATAEDIRGRARRLAAFDLWQADYVAERSASATLADLGAIYDLLPLEARAEDRDPLRLGVRRLHRDLARVAAGTR
ncbi:MAG: hypothetical protein ACOYOB_19435 [Myxococcota bacterium]